MIHCYPGLYSYPFWLEFSICKYKLGLDCPYLYLFTNLLQVVLLPFGWAPRFTKKWTNSTLQQFFPCVKPGINVIKEWFIVTLANASTPSYWNFQFVGTNLFLLAVLHPLEWAPRFTKKWTNGNPCSISCFFITRETSIFFQAAPSETPRQSRSTASSGQSISSIR